MSTIYAPTHSPASFSFQVAGRFMWKELRKMRTFAIGVAALTLLIMLLVRWGEVKPNDIPGLMMAIAFGAAVLLAIGSSITAFSVEREEQTATFLQNLPRYWVAMFVGKVAATLLLAFVFAGVMSLVGGVVAGFRWPSLEFVGTCFLQGGLIILEATAWSFVVSLLVRRPLLAAVLACAATSASSQVEMWLSDSYSRKNQWEDYSQGLPVVLLLIAVAFVAAALLARRWLALGTNERGSRMRAGQPLALSTTSRTSRFTLPLQSVAPRTGRGMLVRLWWQTLRESWPMMLGVVASGLLLMLAFEAVVEAFIGGVILSVLFIPGLCGALTFRCDHARKQYRFLAEHAARPQAIWFVRIATWGAYLLLAILLLALPALAVFGRFWWNQLDHLSVTSWSAAGPAKLQVESLDYAYYGGLGLLLAIFTAFAVGQLASLLLKSEILAGGVSLFASIGILLFWGLIILWRLPPLWCLLPPLVGMLVASYIRFPDWLIDQNSAWRWIGTVAAVLLPTALVVESIPFIRSAQIENATSRFSALATGPSLAEAIQAYHQRMEGAEEVNREYQEVIANAWGDVASLTKPSPPAGEQSDSEVEDSDDQNPPSDSIIIPSVPPRPGTIEKLIELTKIPAVEYWGDTTAIKATTQLLLQDFDRALAAGELDAALERLVALRRLEAQVAHSRYGPIRTNSSSSGIKPDQDDRWLAWMTATGQSVALIERGMKQLAEANAQFPPAEHRDIANCLDAQRLLESPGDIGWAPWFHKYPGEKARSAQALELLGAMTVDYYHRVDQQTGPTLRKQLHNASALGTFPLTLVDNLGEQERQRYDAWLTAQSSQFALERYGNTLMPYHYMGQYKLRQTQHAMEQIRLAQVAFYIDHGAYLPTLERQLLVPRYLPAMPVDPFSGEMFQFSPAGIPDTLSFNDLTTVYQLVQMIPLDTPFLWSVGPGNCTLRYTSDGDKMILQETEPQWNGTVLLKLPKESDLPKRKAAEDVKSEPQP